MQKKSVFIVIIVIIYSFAIIISASDRNSIFQFAIDVPGRGENLIRAYLWIPPESKKLRGLLIGGQTLMEEKFVTDPLIRKACSETDLGIVYFNPALDPVFDPKKSGKILLEVLDKLAEISDYNEIKIIPWMPFGHSVSSIFAKNVAYWKPERCFAVFLQKGGGIEPPDWATNNVKCIPVMILKGQFEEFGPGPSGVLRDFETREVGWQYLSSNISKMRHEDKRWLVSLLIHPGGSHMTWPSEVGHIIGMFIKKSAEIRIPKSFEDDKVVLLNPVDHDKGAVTAVNPMGENFALAADKYRGELSNTMWHCDLELAETINNFHSRLKLKPQFVTFIQPNGDCYPWGHDMRMRISPSVWIGHDTFKLSGKFIDYPPPKYPKVNDPITHVEDEVRFKVLAGPLEYLSNGIFRILYPIRGKQRYSVVVYHPGDSNYRYCEQPAFLTGMDAKGNTQKITFEDIPEIINIQQNNTVELKASSSSGLPVRFAVESGPGYITNNTLIVTDIPPRCKLPIKLKIIAYQAGSFIEPKYSAASPEVKEILITKR